MNATKAIVAIDKHRLNRFTLSSNKILFSRTILRGLMLHLIYLFIHKNKMCDVQTNDYCKAENQNHIDYLHAFFIFADIIFFKLLYPALKIR